MRPTDQFFDITPPSNFVGPNTVQTSATGAAAGVNLFSGLGANSPKGNVFVCFEATTVDAFVRFGPATSAGTTALNGAIIKAGQPGRVFMLNPTRHKFMDVFSAGGSIQWHVCSRPCGLDAQ